MSTFARTFNLHLPDTVLYCVELPSGRVFAEGPGIEGVYAAVSLEVFLADLPEAVIEMPKESKS